MFFLVENLISYSLDLRIKSSIIRCLKVKHSLVHEVDKSDVKLEEKKEIS